MCLHTSTHMSEHVSKCMSAGVFEGLLLTELDGFSKVGVISLAVLGLVVIPYPCQLCTMAVLSYRVLTFIATRYLYLLRVYRGPMFISW